MLPVHEHIEFIDKIVQDADLGYSFIPFVGSGLSSPSGIIMGIEFTNYLAFTTYLVLANPEDRPKTHGEDESHRWDIAKKGWPPLPTKDEVDLAREWIRKRFEALCQQLQLQVAYDGEDPQRIKSLIFNGRQSPAQELVSVLSQPAIPYILLSRAAERIDSKARYFIDFLAKGAQRPDIYPGSFAIDEMVPNPNKSYHQRIEEMGIRSLHDWRETLAFLASVSVQESVDGTRLVYEPKCNTAVIDAFNTAITRDRKPNLGHKILAHLAGPLRIQTLLTTNFDTLIEDAYRALSLSIRVLPVTTMGSLPTAATVAEVDSVVKLHGEAHDTRADLSLDDEPCVEDLRTFAEYLTCGGGRQHGRQSRHSKRLLVVGYSGSDNRCVQMIKHWLETAPDQPIVYWICFTNGDVDKVRQLFSAPEYAGKVRITQSARPDLLLYEVYQRVVLSLPPGGLVYEFSHNVPPSRFRKYDFEEALIRRTLECTQQTGNLMEAARVLYGSVGSPADLRSLARDAVVWELKDALISLIGGDTARVTFAQPSEEPLPPKPWICRWQPWYRSPSADVEDQSLSAYIVNSVGGVVRASSMAVDHATSVQWKKVFWMETQDYMDVDALMRDFFRTLALRLGQFQNRHVSLHPLDQPIVNAVFGSNGPTKEQGKKKEASEKEDDVQQIDFGWPGDPVVDSMIRQSKAGKATDKTAKNDPVEHVARTIDQGKCLETVAKIKAMIKRVLTEYRASASNLVVMLYGRDSYGTCSGLIPSIWKSDTAFSCLHLFIEALASAGITVIYFPLMELRSQQKKGRKLEVALRENDEVKVLPAGGVVQQPDQSNAAVQTDEPRHFRRESPYSVFPDMLATALSPLFKVTVGASGAEKDNLDFETIRVRGADLSSLPQKERAAAERRLIFLYAITLFRHSRHPAALGSDATFQCPFRFNSHAIDNDFLRWEESAQWISALRQAAVFLDKPGGSMWMRRDIRLTIRQILESIEIDSRIKGATLGGGGGKSSPEVYSRRSLLDSRARLHFWIGDWYFKAFCSSGHLIPLIETVHHRIMAAIFSPMATPKVFADIMKTKRRPSQSQKHNIESVTKYRRIIFESSLQEAAKAFLLAKPQLKVWQASSIDASWIGKSHRDAVRTRLEQTRTALMAFETERGVAAPPEINERLGYAIDFLDATMTVVCDTLTTEGGGQARDAKASTDLRLYSFNHYDKREEDHERPKLSSRWQRVCDREVVFEKTIKNEFTNLTNDISLYTALTLDSADRKVVELKASWRTQYAGDRSKLSKMVWLLVETSYLYLRRAKLYYHATGRIAFEQWRRSARASNMGIELCRHLPFSQMEFQLQSLVKLHSLYGLALANLGRFFEANRYLNEAQALLSKTPGASGADFAIVSLRRAEARLTECYWIRLFLAQAGAGTTETLTLRADGVLQSDLLSRHFGPKSDVRLVNGDSMHEGWSEAHLENLISLSRKYNDPREVVFVPPKISECFRKSLVPRLQSGSANLLPVDSEEERWKHALRNNLLRLYSGTLDEAWSLLEQASAGLCGTSQSSLWWCRYHTLKIRAFAALEPLGVSAAESLAFRKESPDLGLHDAFTSAVRISGSDVFRQFRAVKYFFEANQWLAGYTQDLLLQTGRAGHHQKGKDTLMPDTFRLAVRTLSELSIAASADGWTKGDGATAPSIDDYPLVYAVRRLYFWLQQHGILDHVLKDPSFQSLEPLLRQQYGVRR